MTTETAESLKWVVGVPTAIAAALTLPWVVRKYWLECRKLRLEIAKLEAESPAVARPTNGRGLAVQAWLAEWGYLLTYSMMACVLVANVFVNNYKFMIVGIWSYTLFQTFVNVLSDRHQKAQTLQALGLAPAPRNGVPHGAVARP